MDLEQMEMDKISMKGRCPGIRSRGQGLVEYALLIALIALLSIVALVIASFGVQRIYGVIAGSLGIRHNTMTQAHSIEIISAQCIAVQSQNATRLSAVGNTD